MPLPRLQSIRRLAAIGLAALCGCQPAPTIKVAFIGGLSGHVSDLAIDGRNGAQLAIETLNAQPGPRYELHVHDDSRPPEAAAATIDAVADEGDAFALDLDSPEPAYVDFRKRFIERFGNPPSQAAVFSYDATMLGAEGLRRKSERQSLRDVLRAPGEWPGLQLPVVLDHFGDSIHGFHLSEVRKGRFVMLGT
jgi:ABC-type branched-subunit amino acid transport system substrate-binding protein